MNFSPLNNSLKTKSLMKKFFIACAMFIASSITAWADSPITSTDFAKAYQDVPIVAGTLALNGNVVTTSLINYLINDENPVDVKVAAINAVAFDKDVYTPMMDNLKAKFNTNSEITVLGKIGASTHTALAYARARCYYLDLSEAYILGYSAFLKDPDGFTTNMVYALMLTTDVLSRDFCQVYKICNAVVTNSQLKQDMRPQAITMMMEYINLYKNDCK